MTLRLIAVAAMAVSANAATLKQAQTIGSGAPLQQCLILREGAGLRVAALAREKQVEFLDKEGKISKTIKLKPGLASIDARVGPEASVIGIYMRPPYGEKENALRSGAYLKPADL